MWFVESFALKPKRKVKFNHPVNEAKLLGVRNMMLEQGLDP